VESSRRALFEKLRGAKQDTQAKVVRPPYGPGDSSSWSVCQACESKACAKHCDEKIIVIGEDGSPQLDFSKSGCTFCEECANVCDEGVLDSVKNPLEHIEAQIQIDFERCVAHAGVICASCKEPCIDDAIAFNGLFNPVILNNSCTACGFCLGRCPVGAIEVIGYNRVKESNDDIR